MKKYPNVTVKIIFKCKDEILMLKHGDGVFDFPGGRMEWGESIFEALKRELEEELAYSPEGEPELFSVWNYISKNKKRHSVFLNYIQGLDEKPVISSPEKHEIHWFSKEDIKSKKIIKDEKFIDKIFGYGKT
ncbi:MAG: NUDIX hydrolase [Candidatus Paceibacterota bacterium]|jgi:8-oxo-dGTP diphosphatase